MPPYVAVCAGGACTKKHQKSRAKLLKDLRSSATTVETKCLGICNGPVVVVDPTGDRPVVIAKVRGKQERRSTVAAVTDPTKRPKKNPGKADKAIARAAKSVARSA